MRASEASEKKRFIVKIKYIFLILSLDPVWRRFLLHFSTFKALLFFGFQLSILRTCVLEYAKLRHWHRRLVHKLGIPVYGFGESYIRSISNFLNERKQKVVVNGQESAWKDVTSGILQSWVLGPMFFGVAV